MGTDRVDPGRWDYTTLRHFIEWLGVNGLPFGKGSYDVWMREVLDVWDQRRRDGTLKEYAE